jgi:anti-anti-sigma regulatory factor
MAGPSAHLEVARTDAAVYIRVVGYGTFALARPLREFADACVREGQRKFILDLTGAVSVDSTFMGTLAGLTTTVDPAGDGSGWIQAVNPSSQCRKVMADVGLEKLIRVRAEPVEMPSIPLTRVEVDLGTPAQRVRTAAEAHRHLLPLDSENERRFRPVLQLLEKELREFDRRGE